MSKKDLPTPTRTEMIPVYKMAVDHRYQRELIQGWVDELADTLELDKVGIFTVSDRGEEKYWILNGQQRKAALIQRGLGELRVLCHVYEGLTPEEEALVFEVLNKTRHVAPFDKFRSGVFRGDPECTEILSICQDHGLEVTRGTGDGCVACVGSLQKVYRNDNGRPGSDILHETLETVISAWGPKATAVEGTIIRGIGELLGIYGDQIDHPAFIKKLSKIPAGGSGLVGKAKIIREMEGGTVARNVARAARGVYNKGRSVGALPPL